MATSKATLSPKLLETARIELNEDQSQVSKAIEAIRLRILADPKLNFRTDDAFLLRYLRARKFDQERTFELIANYYRQRKNFPSLYSRFVSFQRKDGWTSKMVEVLPRRGSDGTTVVVHSYHHWDCDLVSAEDKISLLLLSYERLLQDESVQINGVILVVDFAGLNMGHIKVWTPGMLREVVSVFFNAFPLRIKAMHFVNMTSLFDGFLAVLKPLLSKKMQDRIFYHGNCLASLHEHVDPEMLPVELGGDLSPPDEYLWAQTMKEQAEILARDLQFGFLQDK